MRDQAVRHRLGMSIKVACRLARVAPITLIKWELDPSLVKDPGCAARLAKLFSEARGLLTSMNDQAA